MTFKLISQIAPNARRVVPLDPATVTTIAVKPGQIVKQGAAPNRYAVKADGAAVVGAPLWAFTDTTRKDTQKAAALTVIDGPFVAQVDTDGYAGTPTLDQALTIGTGGDVGKLAAVAGAVDSVAKVQSIVAYCTMVPNADGLIEFKAIR